MPALRQFIFLLSTVAVAALLQTLPAPAADQRDANFVFLVDVSGSMVSKSTMVPSAAGQPITLFEALRQALKQIVRDERLIQSKSRVAFITFGTQITEKSTWPARLSSVTDRNRLVECIDSPAELKADPHGDTYMAGALDLAYKKASEFESQSDPCTTTFIVMLTDGWDEPPKGAKLKIQPVAARFLAKQKGIEAKLGVNTWQLRVIGLQRLPEKKAGTTTAQEVAALLHGEFIDVTKHDASAAADRIFTALKETIAGLPSEIKLWSTTPINFGSVDENGLAAACFPVLVRSCYDEKITGVSCTRPESITVQLFEKEYVLSAKKHTTGPAVRPQCELAFNLPKGARLRSSGEIDWPPLPEPGLRGPYLIVVVVRAGPGSPPGKLTADLILKSTAGAPQAVPFTVALPARLITPSEPVRATAHKPGFFRPESTTTTLELPVRIQSGQGPSSTYGVTLSPTTAVAEIRPGDRYTLPADVIHKGKPLTIELESGSASDKIVKIAVDVPAEQAPGTYRGSLAVAVKGPDKITAVEAIPFEVVVKPSAWEEVAPIAVPILLAVAFCAVLGTVLWLSRLRAR